MLYKKTFTLFTVVLLFVTLTSIAQAFGQSPVVTDNKGIDRTFSVNSEKSDENEAVIAFSSNGNAGDYQVIVDTHRDGVFDPADWVGSVVGMDGATGSPQTFSELWNGALRNVANSDKVSDGEYSIRVHLDYKPNGRIDENDPSYQTRDVSVIVDSAAPTLSADAPPLSPNGDGLKDTTTISYKLSENLLKLEFKIVPELPVQPALAGVSPTRGKHTVTWNGKDGLGDTLEDSVYNWQLIGTDAGGNVGEVSFQIQIDTKPPIISSTSPANSDFVNTPIANVTANLDPTGGAAIDYDEVDLTLTAPNAQPVNGVLKKDDANSILTLTLTNPLIATNDNGAYTLTVTAKDEAGNSLQETARFVFDNQNPTIVSVSTAEGVSLSLSDPSTLLPAQTSLLIRVQDKGNSGINFANPDIGLKSPAGQSVNIERSNNGVDTITVAYESLPEAGAYRLEIASLSDKAGNVLSNVTYQFKYQPAAPTLPTVSVITPANGALVKDQITGVEATLQDFSGKGLDLNGSTIRLLQGNSVIPGLQTNDGVSVIRWQLIEALATDGSADGAYTIAITPVDKANNTGQERQTTFLYDTQAPKVVSLNPINIAGGAVFLKQPFEVISAVFSDDAGTGVNFANTQIELKDAEGNVVAGTADNNGTDTLNFRLTNPLPRDGSKDGSYTVMVSAADKAGNVSSLDFTFIYDTQIPTVASTQPAKDAKITTTISEVKVLLQDVTSGVDLTNTGVVVRMPDGSPIVADTSHDGVNTITLNFASLETDGTQDGVYTIEITPVDKAGNSVSGPVSIDFTYATKLPEIVALTLKDNAIINQLNSIEVTFVEYSGEGIDFDNSAILVKDKDGQEIPGTLSDDQSATLTWQIRSPLSRDGTQDGLYSITVSVTDNVGNQNAKTTHFVFDSQIPTIVSTTPAANAKVNALNQVVVKLADATSSVDLADTQIQLLAPNGTPVGATATHDGADTITLKFDALKMDGSQDGTYTIEVTPKDIAGNIAGSPTRIEFAYATISPEVASISPAHLAFVKSVSKVEATLIDHSGEGIDFDASTITLKDKDGKDVAGRQQNDASTLIWFEPSNPFPTDGTYDKEYTVSLHIVDKVGSSADYTAKFSYDSQPPKITLITPADKTTLKTNVVTIEISVADGEGSGVDFDASTVTLQGPAGIVNGLKTGDGVSKITYTPDKLPQTGKYTIVVTLVDRAGNSSIPLQSSFDYAIEPPRVLAVTPANKAKINQVDVIKVTLEDNSGTGLDFSPTATSIILTGPNNAEIEGATSHTGDEITFTLAAPLATDGAEDGVYTITVTPVDNTGTTGVEKRYTFTYDTQAPDIASVTNIDMTANVSIFSGEIGRLEAVLQDAGGTGINFETSTISLKNNDGEVVKGEAGSDEESKIWWQLASTLPRGGGSDGLYTVSVTAFDKAGNKEEKDYALLYDTVVPTVKSTTPADGTTVSDSISQISVTLADGNSGINLTASTVQLAGPQGIVGANQGDNGADTIILTFNALKTDGSDDGAYTINITPVDKAGNTLTSPVGFEFFYVTVMPEVYSTVPAGLSYVTGGNGEPPLHMVSATLLDHSGEGIDLEKSTISLIAPDGKEVAGRQTDDENSVINWVLARPLPTDGTADGEYTIKVEAVDKTGSAGSSQSKFYYDTNIPTVTQITPADKAVLASPIAEITIVMTDGEGSGVDLANTDVKLKSPSGADISGNQKDNGEDTITLTFPSLTQEGAYIVEVTPRDLASNVSLHPVTFTFSLELKLPIVTAVKISDAEPEDYTNALTKVTATLKDQSGVGLNLTSAGSTIRVQGPQGEVDGEGTADADKQEIVWIPVLPLATDGTDDGTYTITITPMDNTGRVGQIRQHITVYDTQTPEVSSTTPDVIAPAYIKPFVSKIDATLTDVGPAGLEIKAQTIRLQDVEGNEVSGVQSDDKTNRITWTLTTPLPTDGTADGEYIFQLTLVDQANNTATYEQKFLYDSQIPTITEINPEDKAVSLLNEITVTLSDDDGSGVDLAGTEVKLQTPSHGDVIGNKKYDNQNTITFSFPDQTQEGTYVIEVTPKDLAGNVSAHPFVSRVSLVLKPPTVIDVTISGVAPADFVNQLTQITAQIEDRSGLGIDLTDAGSTIRVTGPQGEVEGEQTSDGTDTLTWKPILPLATDGSDDGNYTIIITPKDNAARTGQARQYQIVYDTQAPEVTWAAPVDLNASVSYVGSQIAQVEAQVNDVGPADLEIKDQNISLETVSGAEVAGTRLDDANQRLSWTLITPLATDSTADGKYVMVVDVTDKAGNKATYKYDIVYDTQAPTVVKTEPAADAVISGSIDVITAQLQDAGDGQIDFAASHIELFAPDNNKITGAQSNNARDTITFRFKGLELDGTYTTRVNAVDKAGNSAAPPVEVKFFYSTSVPIVLSTKPITSPPDEAFTNEQITAVEAILQETNNGGIDFSPSGSDIELLDQNGNRVDGVKENNGVDTITWKLLKPLAVDGTDDGDYTIKIVPVNKAKRRGDEVRFSFVYDTVPPEVEAVFPLTTETETGEPGNSLGEIYAFIADKQPSSDIDWETATSDWIKLVDESGKDYPGNIFYDSTNVILILQLIVPLASNGSQDGFYTVLVAPKDKAGNALKDPEEFTFFYDTKAPVVDVNSLNINGKPLITDTTADEYPTSVNTPNSVVIAAKLTDDGLGADLSKSTIKVTPPSGEAISGKVIQNGVDTIQLTTGALTQEGLYRITITTVGLDVENVGIQPSSEMTTTFLFETTKPVAQLNDYGGRTTIENETVTLKGTALDEARNNVDAAGVALVEIGGTGPGDTQLDWIPAKDDSKEKETPWSSWSLDFLPSESGEYELVVRVTDEAGNFEIYEGVTLNFTVSLGFRGKTYAYPVPANRSIGQNVIHFSFDLNIATGSKSQVTLSIYNIAGVLVSQKVFPSIGPGREITVTWDLKNKSGADVARGVYLFRIEADDGENKANEIGKILVVK